MSVWNNMESVLFIAPEEWLNQSYQLKSVLKEFFHDVRKIEVIIVTDKRINIEKRDENEWFTFFSHKDFNLFGKLKNEKIGEIVLNSYDTIFVCLTLNKRLSKRVFKSQNGRSIGLNSGDFQGEINLQSKSNEPREIVNFAKNTLLKITS